MQKEGTCHDSGGIFVASFLRDFIPKRFSPTKKLVLLFCSLSVLIEDGRHFCEFALLGGAEGENDKKKDKQHREVCECCHTGPQALDSCTNRKP